MGLLFVVKGWGRLDYWTIGPEVQCLLAPLNCEVSALEPSPRGHDGEAQALGP